MPRNARRIAVSLLAGCALAASVRADSVVVFNEIHYNPPGGASEWIELRNQFAVDVDISAWSLAKGVRYTFPAGTILPAGGFVVIAANPLEIPGSLGPWEGRLDNASDQINLLNNSLREMDALSYQSEGGWPVAADGFGLTLAKRNRNLPSGEAESWRASESQGGTPGAENFSTARPAVTTPRVTAAAVWHHLSTGIDPGADWRSVDFDASTWPEATGAFQLGTDPLPAPAVAATALPAGPTTYWFRTRFAFAGEPATTRLAIRLLVDDGAAVYLNGSELVRLNLVSGATATTPALIPRRAAPRFASFDVPGWLLRTGENVLAVELHQAPLLAAYPAAVVAATPAGYWRMGETSASVHDLADLPPPPESGPQDGAFAGMAAGDMSLAGPRPTDTIGGQPLAGFDSDNRAPQFQGNNIGGDDVLTVPDDGALNFAATRAFSFAVWVKGNPTQESGGAVIAKGTGGGGEQFALDFVNNNTAFSIGTAARLTTSQSPSRPWLLTTHGSISSASAMPRRESFASTGTASRSPLPHRARHCSPPRMS